MQPLNVKLMSNRGVFLYPKSRRLPCQFTKQRKSEMDYPSIE
nr:MAG TPA: hypothetical protein [Caudoviricetes sp.]